MTFDPDSSPARAPQGEPPRRGPWRFGTPLVVIACGALFVTSFANSQGTDLRPGRYTDLSSLVSAETREYEELEERVRELTADVERLTGQVGDSDVREIQQRVDAIKESAGLTPLTGPGITVTLSDAPEEVINTSDQAIKLLIVHQQDIQAVVNAMWAGGAEAITIQGRRIISTTGIKCEGNAVMLGGAVYPEPYVISAIGNPAALEAAIDQDPFVQGYRAYAAQPDVSVGFDMQAESAIEAPAYEGLTNLSFAQPIR